MSHLRESFITKQERGDLDVKLTSHRKVVVRANERMVVWGITRPPPDGTLMAIIEPSSEMEKTGVITVMPGLVTLHRGVGTCKVPIEITNTTSKPVTIHPKTRIATVHHASSIVDTSSMPRSNDGMPKISLTCRQQPLMKDREKRLLVCLTGCPGYFL